LAFALYNALTEDDDADGLTLGVSLLYDDGPPGEEQPEALAVLVAHPDGVDALVAKLHAVAQAHHPELLLPQFTQRTMALEAWADAWKAFWKPRRLSPRLILCPSWEVVAPERPEDAVIVLDPGSAFGTGEHHTTQLMLQAVDAEAQRLAECGELAEAFLLDVGTGSGVLAIAACKLGFTKVLATDIDAHAVSVAQTNAELNAVEGRCTWLASASLPLPPLADAEKPTVIVANIVRSVLVELLPSLASWLPPHGRLWLSGLITPDLPLIEAAAERVGLVVIQQKQQGQGHSVWYALCLAHQN
jgi:ribosomal protein L11 methyltransferase